MAERNALQHPAIWPWAPSFKAMDLQSPLRWALMILVLPKFVSAAFYLLAALRALRIENAPDSTVSP